MNSIFHLLLALALLCTMHLHLPLLQVVAWSGMLVGYSREAPLREAVVKTFDGAHPCKLCCAIRKEIEKIPADQMRAPAPPALKVYLPVPARVVASLEHAGWVVNCAIPAPPMRCDEPEIPPPRDLA